MQPQNTTRTPRIALLVEPPLLTDLLRFELERLGATVLVDDTTSRVDLVIASAARTTERPQGDDRWVTIPAHGPTPTIVGTRGTLVEHLGDLLATAMEAASG